MKILFVCPNDYLCVGIPTGVATLSAVLKNAGHIVGLFDFTFVKTKDYNKKNLNANQGIYLPTAYTLEDLVVNDPVETIESAFAKKIQEFRPDLIAVSSMTGNFSDVINLLKMVKPSCQVIVGGVHATLCPGDVLSEDTVDFVCIGEGEKLMVELCDKLENGEDYSKIENLGYKKGSNFIYNQIRPFIDLDVLPAPDWSIFDERHLFRPFLGKIYKGSFYAMSRGCPQHCTYCVNSSLRNVLKDCGKYYRFQSPQTTINQLKYLKEKYGATWFKFVDDSIMLFTEEYLEELADGLKELNIQFGCSVRPETTTKRKVELLKSMGCVAASVGIESGNEELRKKILNRWMTNEQIETAIKILKDYGIRVSTFNMISLPEETRDDVFQTIKLNKKMGIEAVNFYAVYPYPGTELNKKYGVNIFDQQGKIIPVAKASSFALSKMSPLEVEGLLKTVDLYIELPEERWPIIKRAEGTDKIADELRFSLYNSTTNNKL